ncbi:MAG TPA: AbrB/MazE/SpoVT family DNA-binding domain-containing protein [Candidatus Nanoarchaeia archaeon]|nr:AbrB/MazE/SpoVT family DNA-binding domain-containing protein [Candidatus Nanoarchaeia archaeon]
MKRKIIQVGHSTQLVSLPRKWCLSHNIRKGDEIEVEEKGQQIVVSKERIPEVKKIEIDVSGLDRTSIIIYIRGLYIRGFDEIGIHFSKPSAYHFRTREFVDMRSIIRTEVERLIGVEVLSFKDDFCMLKDLSEPSFKDFEVVLRRIFMLLLDMLETFIEGLKQHKNDKIHTIEDKHGLVTKFASYTLRILNKRGYPPDPEKVTVIYHTIAMLDKVRDTVKYSAREAALLKKKMDDSSITNITLIYKNLHLFYGIFYKYDPNRVTDMYHNRDMYIRRIKDLKEKIPPAELLILTSMEPILEFLVELTKILLSLQEYPAKAPRSLKD